jgi:hypothetical protein
MQFIDEYKKFIYKLKNKHFTSWLYVVVGYFLFFELVYLFSNWEYYQNVKDLWRFLDFNTKQEFITRIVFIIGVILLIYRLEIAWIVTSGIVLQKAYSSLLMVPTMFFQWLFSQHTNGLKIETSFFYIHFGAFGSFLYFAVKSVILIFILIFLWKSDSLKQFKIKFFHYVIVALLFSVLLYLKYHDLQLSDILE